MGLRQACPSCGAALHIPPDREQWRCGYCGSDFLASDAASAAVSISRQVHHEVDNDPNMGYEHNKLIYNLILPFFWLITIWAFLKTAGWALLTFIRHEELVYEVKSGKPQRYAGRKKVVKWFNLNAAIRVWYCIPQEKRGESLKPNYMFYDRLSPALRSIRYGAASWKALDIIYNHRFGADKSLGGRLADFGLGVKNAQAVRNRHRLIVRELTKSMASFNKSELKILSVACGSAQAVIESVKTVKDRHGIIARVTLLDLDQKALEYAKALAVTYEIFDQFDFVNENIKNLESAVKGPFDVIEMLGFFDYQVYNKAIVLVRRLRALLSENGHFLTCNISYNSEQYLLRWAVSWPMIYRDHSELAKILLVAGFSAHKVQIITEPHEIHMIAICRN